MDKNLRTLKGAKVLALSLSVSFPAIVSSSNVFETIVMKESKLSRNQAQLSLQVSQANNDIRTFNNARESVSVIDENTTQNLLRAGVESLDDLTAELNNGGGNLHELQEPDHENNDNLGRDDDIEIEGDIGRDDDIPRDDDIEIEGDIGRGADIPREDDIEGQIIEFVEVPPVNVMRAEIGDVANDGGNAGDNAGEPDHNEEGDYDFGLNALFNNLNNNA